MPGFSLEDIWHRRQEGLPKLLIIRQALRLRHEWPHAFGPQGHYSPLYARGEKSSHVVSFMLGGEVIAIAPRLFLSLKEGWDHTVIDLPEGRWRHEFDGRVFDGGICRLHEVLRTFPVGLLCKIE